MSLQKLRFRQSLEKSYHLLMSVLLGLSAYTLNINFSKDWHHYEFFFHKQTQPLSWEDILTQMTVFKEPFYHLTSKFGGELIGFSLFILLTTLVLLIVKLNYLKKITKGHYAVSVFYYVCFYLLLFEGTQLRIAYATSFIMMAFYFMQREKIFISLCLVMVASQIHLSALVFLIMFPLFIRPSINNLIYVVVVVAPFFILFDVSLFSLAEMLMTKLNPKYIYYFQQKTRLVQNSTGLFYYFIGFFAGLLAIVFYYLKESINRDKFLKMLFSIALCGIIAMCTFHDYVAMAARLGELLLLPIVILFSYLYMHFYSNKMRLQQIALLFLATSYFFGRMVYLYPTMLTG